MLPTITIDVGTTSVKLSLFDAAGEAVVMERTPTPTVADAWGEIYEVGSLARAIAEFLARLEPAARAEVRRVAIAGVGESGGLVRSDLTLASPMIVWHDHRGAEHLAVLEAHRSLVYRITGLPINANYALSKVRWAVDHAEHLGDAQWLNIAEYLAARMTGIRWAEYSLASRTLALDLGRRTWSERMCELMGLGTGIFPELRTAGDGSRISSAFAHETGLHPETRVIVAGHDHMVGAIGAGLEPGELLNSTGTTEGLLMLGEAPELGEAAGDAKLANGISCTGAGFTLFASIPTGGSAFATLQTLLGWDEDRLRDSVRRVHEGYLDARIDLARVPLVLPRFRGSPPPDKRAEDLGAVAGIRHDTTADEIVLGCFLGMALQFRDVLELFPEQPGALTVIGPAAENPLWLQLKADLLGTPLRVLSSKEIVSRGAQVLASGGRPALALPATELRPEPALGESLGRWASSHRPRWEHLKETPS